MANIAWSISDGRLVVPGSADELLTYFYRETHDWDKAYVKSVQWLNDLSATVKTQWDLDDYQRWTQDLDVAYANRVMAPVPSGPSWWSREWLSLKNMFGKWLSPGIPSGSTNQPSPEKTDYRWVFYGGAILLAIWVLKQPSAENVKKR